VYLNDDAATSDDLSCLALLVYLAQTGPLSELLVIINLLIYVEKLSLMYKIYTYTLVMQQFGNLKVGSVFGFLHHETAVSVFGFGLKAKTRCLRLLLRSTTTSYFVVVIRHPLTKKVKTENQSVLKKS